MIFWIFDETEAGVRFSYSAILLIVVWLKAELVWITFYSISSYEDFQAFLFSTSKTFEEVVLLP